MGIFHLLGCLLLVVPCCIAAGGSRHYPPADPSSYQQETGGGSHQPVSNRFGEVDLPLNDDPGLFSFGQATPFDPGMYVGNFPSAVNQQSYYQLPPGDFPPVDNLSYPTGAPHTGQPEYYYTQESDDRYMQPNVQQQEQQPYQLQQQQEQPSTKRREGRRRKSVMVEPPTIFESSTASAPTHAYELPPGLAKEHRKSLQKSKNYTGEPKRKSRADIPFWGEEEEGNAMDDMTAQTAGMRIGSLAPIQMAGGGAYEHQSGSMTSRLWSKLKGKGKEPRLPQEPQTARLAPRVRSKQIEQVYDDEEGEDDDESDHLEVSSGIESDLTRYCRALVQKTWQRRHLNCIQYSAEQLAEIFAELKIAYPGNEWGISKEASSFVRKNLPEEVDQDRFMKDFRKAKNSHRNQINYLKSSYLSTTGREMPPAILLDEFRKAKVKLDESKIRAQQQKSRKKAMVTETKQPRRRTGKQAQQASEQDFSTNYADEAGTADKVWNDFFTTRVAPALSAGYAYDMTLIGYLLPRYVHEEHDQQQTQTYIIKYLHDVQGVSDADLKQLYDAATSGSG